MYSPIQDAIICMSVCGMHAHMHMHTYAHVCLCTLDFAVRCLSQSLSTILSQAPGEPGARQFWEGS